MAEDRLSTLGDRLRKAREDQGWSPAELARQSRVDLAWITRLESGERHNVSIWTARRIARALGVGLDYLADTFGPNDCPANTIPTWGRAVLAGETY